MTLEMSCFYKKTEKKTVEITGKCILFFIIIFFLSFNCPYVHKRSDCTALRDVFHKQLPASDVF